MKGARRPEELTRGPFTARTASANGVTRHALRGASWRRLFHGVWVAADLELDRATWLSAARLALPLHGVLCLLSAVEAYGIDVRRQDDVSVNVAFDRHPPRRQAGLNIRELTLRSGEVVRRDPWLVTSPLRTAFDCARLLGFVEAVVVVDALAHARLIDVESLVAFAAEHPGLRWVRRIPKVIDAADERSESPMESRLRLLLRAAGLPGLEPQYVVRTAAGRFVARLDLAFPDAKVAVEYDGAWHWAQRREDDRRREALRELGWTVLVVSADDYYRTPEAIVSRVRRALASAAA